MAQTNICGNLEQQIDDLLPLYDLAQKAMPFEQTRPVKTTLLNEDSNRQNMTQNWTHGPSSVDVATSGCWFGFLSAFMLTRTTAKSAFDLSILRACPVRTFGLFMAGCTVSSMYEVTKRARKQNGNLNMNLQRRQIQNEQASSLLRTMKFHLGTRQTGAMGVADE